MDCHNTQHSTSTAESARLRAWLFLAAARDVRERAKRTVWPIISEACNAACRIPSRTQHTGQRARGLRDWHWLQERCRADGGGGSLARRVARQEKHALHTHLEGLQAVLREEPVVRVDACAAQAAAVSSGRSSGQMRRGSWRSAHGGSRLRRYSQSAPSCSLILTVSEPPTTPIVTFLRSSFMNAVISGVTSCGARGAAVKTAAASPWLGKQLARKGGRPVRAAAAGSERLLGGAAVLRRTLRGFVSVPSTSNSASTLPLILGDGLRAGVARAESKRGAQPSWERSGDRRSSTRTKTMPL